MTARRATPKRRTPSGLGTVQQLPSGAWRAFYRIDGERFAAPHTFASKVDALAWLATERADRARGVWHDPRHGQIMLGAYARDWLDSRPELSARTRQLYHNALTRWILPRFGEGSGIGLGAVPLAELTPAVIRHWHAAAYTHSRQSVTEIRNRAANKTDTHPARTWARTHGLEVGASGRLPAAVLTAWEQAGHPSATALVTPQLSDTAGQAQVAGAYRLLRTIMNTAVREGLIVANPCQLAGAGSVKFAERVPATADEVRALADRMPDHLAAAVWLAAWSGLRHGELFGLARRHINLEDGTVRVERALLALPGEPVGFGPTKTAKSRRTVALPRFVCKLLADHLARHVPDDPDALIFATRNGTPVTVGRIAQSFHRARAAIGRPDLRWHDLRHTGASLAYLAGASVPDVQRRLGHTTSRAASIYAHAYDDSDRRIADQLDTLYQSLSGEQTAS